MDQRITLITLGVADLGRSRRFYEALGWQRSVKGAESVAFYQAGGAVLSLYPLKNLAEDVELTADGSGFRGMSIAINMRTRGEVDTAINEAKQAGASLIRAAKDVFWGGYVGYFADPDGHMWEIAWNPTFAMTEDGRLVLPD